MGVIVCAVGISGYLEGEHVGKFGEEIIRI